MLNLFKQIKARLLKKWAAEILEENVILKSANRKLNVEIKSLLNKRFYGSNVILSKSMVKVLFEILPTVNENRHKFSDLTFLKSIRGSYYDFRGKLQIIQLIGLIPLEEKNEEGDPRFKNEVTGLKFRSSELGIDFELLFLLRNNLGTTMHGTNLEIQTYVWDLASSRIQIVSDQSLDMMKEFVMSADRTLKEMSC